MPLFNPTSSAATTATYVGYNTIGASFETMPQNKIYYKQVVLTSQHLLFSVSAYVKSGNTANADSFAVGILNDNSGPNRTLASSGTNSYNYIDTTARWLDTPICVLLTAGTYWLAIAQTFVNGTMTIAYDAGGTDPTLTANTGQYAGADLTLVGPTTATTRSFSIRALLL